MFALEIDFHDGISPPETILVRRSNAIVGSSERAHVVIEGAASSLCELQLVRGLGREFRCHPVRRTSDQAGGVSFLEGTYQGDVELRLGELSVNVTSLDIDFRLLPDEFPDKAAIRVLRSALTTKSPQFPALAVLGSSPVIVSFPDKEPLMIGRSRECGLRLDASEVSSSHARVGVEGDRCWVEDLGSTNGTYVGEERISGRRYLNKGERIIVGSELVMMPLLSNDDVHSVSTTTGKQYEPGLVKSFPCIVSQSKEVRPMRFPLKAGAKVSVGRDPANDIWISAPHVSRNHLDFYWSGDGPVEVIDRSSNGSFFMGNKLLPGEQTKLQSTFSVLDLSSELRLAVCYAEDEENAFWGDEGSRSESVDEFRTFPTKAESITDTAVDLPSFSSSVGKTISGGLSVVSPDDDVRSILERAAGISEDLAGEDEADKKLGVFERLANRRANKAKDRGEAASKYLDSIDQEVGQFSEAVESDVPKDELSDFERYQKESLDNSAGMFELDSDYHGLDEFDGKLFEVESYRGNRGWLTVVGLVVFIVVACVVIIAINL